MSAYFYDEALKEKLKRWTEGTKISVTDTEETQRLFEMMADTTNDSPLKLPLICIRRARGFRILSLGKKPLSYGGVTFKANTDMSSKLNAIPIAIPYQLDVYTRYYKEADEYARNLIFNIINYPKLEIEIPYENANLKHVSNIRLTSGVEDNSNVPERLSLGQFTRMTIGIEIDDAYLFDVRTKNNYSMGYQLWTAPSPFENETTDDKEPSFPTDENANND